MMFESVLTIVTDDIGIIRVEFETESEHETLYTQNDLLDGIAMKFTVIDYNLVTKTV